MVRGLRNLGYVHRRWYKLNQGTNMSLQQLCGGQIGELEKANLVLIVGQVSNVEGLTQVKGERAGEEGKAKIYIKAEELMIS